MKKVTRIIFHFRRGHLIMTSAELAAGVLLILFCYFFSFKKYTPDEIGDVARSK